jgi:hypothetical protein
MIFSYVKYKIAPTKTIPSGEIHRPLIPIRIIGPKGEVEVFGLLDTGADNVFVSASLAEILGTDVNDEAEKAIGAAGHEIDVWPGSVEIEIAQDSHRWPVEAGFLVGDDDPPIAYLGHAGFLEHFRATFDTKNWLIELVPHAGSYPSV